MPESRRPASRLATIATTLLASCALVAPAAAQPPVALKVDWAAVHPFKTVSTTQLLASAFTIPGAPQRPKVLAATAALNTDYTRLQYWYPFPRLTVAELEPPTATSTAWDFAQMDTLMASFYAATPASKVRNINIGTIPTWMFVTPKPVPYPKDASVPDYEYSRTGAQLRDPSGREAGEYFARVYSWYAKGGFTDEHGVFHKSGHHYAIPIWGVLNEVQFEHKMSVQAYDAVYDQSVLAIHRIDPKVQFMGPEYENVDSPAAIKFVEDFLNPKNHLPGVTLDWLSFHNYISVTADAPDRWEDELFGTKVTEGGQGAAGYLAAYRQIDATRARLDPHMRVDMDELGSFYGKDINSKAELSTYPPLYWVASSAFHAYCLIELAKMGADVVSMTQLVAYPNNSPSVAMLNWESVHPNERYQALKLLADTFKRGARWADASVGSPHVAALAYIGAKGRKLLLVNKSDSVQMLDVSGLGRGAARLEVLDLATGEGPPRRERPTGGRVRLAPFALAVLSGG